MQVIKPKNWIKAKIRDLFAFLLLGYFLFCFSFCYPLWRGLNFISFLGRNICLLSKFVFLFLLFSFFYIFIERWILYEIFFSSLMDMKQEYFFYLTGTIMWSWVLLQSTSTPVPVCYRSMSTKIALTSSKKTLQSFDNILLYGY